MALKSREGLELRPPGSGGGGALCWASIFIAHVEGISYRGCDIKVDATHGLDDTIIEPNTLHGKETVRVSLSAGVSIHNY